MQKATVNLDTGIATIEVAATDQLAAFNALPRMCDVINDLGFEAEPHFDEGGW